MKGQVKKTPLLLLAAGGTGGHVFPAQALAEEMLSRGWQVVLWTDTRGLRFSRGFPRGVKIKKIISGTFTRGSVFTRFLGLARLALGLVISWTNLKRLRPSVVVGFGGYPAFPPLLAAHILKLPRLLHEQNGVLGQANRALSTRVDLVVCGTRETALPSGVRSRLVGNPVRAEVLSLANAPFVWPSEGLINFLIIGGSQGADILDRLVPTAIGQMPFSTRSRLQIVHQVRSAHRERVEQQYEDLEIAAYQVADFFADIPQQMVKSHLVIARSGASSVAEIAMIGRPSILIPYAAAANDHQTANAQSLVNASASIAIGENDISAECLKDKITHLLEQPAIAEEMAVAAHQLAMPRAATDFADIVENLVLQP